MTREEIEQKRDQAGRLITDLWHRGMVNQSIVHSAIQVLDVIPDLKNRVFESHMKNDYGMKELALKFVKPMDGLGSSEEVFKVFAEGLAVQTEVNAVTVISAAAIILSHSLADDFFTQCCQIAINLDLPKSWLKELKLGRTVSIREASDRGVEALIAEELEKFKKNIKNKSLPSRAEMLFRHVDIKQNENLQNTDASWFRMSTLKEGDDLRHEIVHGQKLPNLNLDMARKYTMFFHEAAYTALRSVGWEFGIPFHLEQFDSYFPKPKQSV